MSNTIWPEQFNPMWNHNQVWIQRLFKMCSPGFSGAKMGEANFYGKNRENLLKSFIKHSARKVENYEEAFSGSLALSLINHYSLGQSGATIFIEEYIEENQSKYLFSGGDSMLKIVPEINKTNSVKLYRYFRIFLLNQLGLELCQFAIVAQVSDWTSGSLVIS